LAIGIGVWAAILVWFEERSGGGGWWMFRFDTTYLWLGFEALPLEGRRRGSVLVFETLFLVCYGVGDGVRRKKKRRTARARYSICLAERGIFDCGCCCCA
jgi:hypothetical protein